MSHSGDSAILGFSELTVKKQLHSVGGRVADLTIIHGGWGTTSTASGRLSVQLWVSTLQDAVSPVRSKKSFSRPERMNFGNQY